MKRYLRCLKFLQLSIPALLAVVMSSPVHAHAGADSASGWIHGFIHPLGGADHVIAMIAVGLWAAQTAGRAIWLVPLTFVITMMLGGLMGIAGVTMDYAELGIVMSLLVFGVLIAVAIRLPLAVSTAVVGVFALCHGYAHGVEMPHNISSFAYATGFMLSTVLLHTCGIGIALYAQDAGRQQWLRVAGIAFALCGGGFLLAS